MKLPIPPLQRVVSAAAAAVVAVAMVVAVVPAFESAPE